MKSSDSVGITFVNALVGRGALNGVVNLTFGTFQFTPVENGIDNDLVISARLRMDLTCARNLHKSLGDFLAQLDSPQPIIPAAPAEASEEQPAGKVLN